jgi:hypothetical protein
MPEYGDGSNSARGPTQASRFPKKDLKQVLNGQSSWGTAPQQPKTYYNEENSFSMDDENTSQPINGNIVPLGEKAGSRVSLS